MNQLNQSNPYDKTKNLPKDNIETAAYIRAVCMRQFQSKSIIRLPATTI